MKKTNILRIFSITLFCVVSIGLFAQNNKTVTLVVSGEAPSKEEATKQALRSAIEQAFGTFVSANTEVLNDEIIKDEIVTISSGNIAHYEEIDCIKESNGNQFVTVKATVSIGQLANYAKSKGMSAELAGGVFVMNMKIRELNRKNEFQAIMDLQKKLLIMSKNVNFFDYELKLSEPYKEYDKYAVDATIYITPNENCHLFHNIIATTLRALSLSESERSDYLNANMGFKRIKLYDFNRNLKYIYLRNISELYPTPLFSFIFLTNELKFALKDNTGRVFHTFYRPIENEYIGSITKFDGMPLWALNRDDYDSKYIDQRGNEEFINFEFGVTDSKVALKTYERKIFRYGKTNPSNDDVNDIVFVLPTGETKNENFRVWETDGIDFDRKHGTIKIQLLYSEQELEEINNIELFFQQPTEYK